MSTPVLGPEEGSLAKAAGPRQGGWFKSFWFRVAMGGSIFLSVAMGLYTGAPAGFVAGELTLGLSVVLSLWLLAGRRLFNPVQAVVVVFYWWFGIGPTVIALWDVLVDKPEAALATQILGLESLWVVAPGVLLYGCVAKITLGWFSSTERFAKFLLPQTYNYRPKVILIYVVAMSFAGVVLLALDRVGIHGEEETSFFGGTRTTIWWVGVIAAFGSISPFVSSALMKFCVQPWKTIPGKVKILLGVVIAQTVFGALFSGWKSPIVFLGAYFACAYLSRHQKLPWLLLTIGATVFLFVITPFVMTGRSSAIVAGADSSDLRKQIYSEVMKDPKGFLPIGLKAIDVSIFFRGIYPVAGGITRGTGLTHGQWPDDTILWGFETLVPRAINPKKRDQNIGNFFSRTIGAQIGLSNEGDTLNSLATSIPFEFVGNYGIIMGILSFGLIGIFWTILCVWVLSPGRLSSHPLAPFFVLLVTGMESPLGAFLATVRGLIIPMLFCYVVYRWLHRKI